MELFKRIKCMFTDITVTLSHYRDEQTVCQPANIQTLPEEVIIHIFSFLSLGEICNIVPRVCTQWKRLHEDRQLYTMPRILGESRFQDLLRVLDSATHLASPHLEKRYIIETIRKYLVTPDEVKDLTRELTKLFMILSQVTEVNLMGKASYFCKEFQLTPLVKCCVQLHNLKIRSNNSICVRKAELISLCEQLCGTLRVLHLDDCKWTLEGARALNKCRHLIELSIVGYNGRLSEECLLEIANMSSLRHLKIYGCATVNKRTWITMFSNNGLKRLSHLHLSYIDCADEVAVALGTNLNNLTNLYIISCGSLGNNGLKSIIKGCNNLTSLVLKSSGCHATVGEIFVIPTYLPKLKTLYLKLGNPELDSHDWQSALKTRMPNLHILGLDFFGRPN